MDHLYKSQLQAHALKQNLDLPVYATEREGPPHAPRFRSKVTFSGETFQSPDFFPTLKAAEHAAAKIALASLSPSSPQGIDVVVYKNLLQEVAHRESSLLPTYATATSGPSHAPTFITTVEFAGRFFRGEEAKTKKLAEMSAAKVAYMSITSGNPEQTSSLSSSPCVKQEAAKSDVESIQQEIPSQPSKMVTPDVPSKWIEVYDDELPDVPVAPADKAKDIKVAASPVPWNPTNVATLRAPAPNAMQMNSDTSSSAMLKNPTSHCNGTSSCGEGREKKLIVGTGHLSIPSGQRVVCLPWKPDMTLPQDEEMTLRDAEMVFRDDRFIAHRLMKH